MGLFTIILFLLIAYGFGIGITRLVTESEEFFERHLMRIGIGLTTFIAVGLLFNMLRIPLDWRIFAAIALVLIGIRLGMLVRSGQLQNHVTRGLTISIYPIIIIIMFFISFNMYYGGATSYPYLENSDPWAHSIGVGYVAEQKTLFEADGVERVHYIDPYPPAFNFVLGVMHQTEPNMQWVLKFITSLIISFAVVFFFFFARQFTHSSKKAFFASLVLFAVPAFMSHFIWAIALAVPLYAVAFYTYEKIRDDKRWWIIAAVATTALLTITPTHSTYFAVLLGIYLMVRQILERQIMIKEWSAATLGLIGSAALWWVPAILKHGLEGMLFGLGVRSPTLSSIAGTGDRVYSFATFFKAQDQNLINNPVGIGVVATLLLLAGLCFVVFKFRKELNQYKIAIGALAALTVGTVVFALSNLYVRTRFLSKEQLIEQGRYQSIGFGQFFAEQTFQMYALSILIIIFIIAGVAVFKNQNPKQKYLVVALAWLAFTFYAVNAAPYDLKLSPFRAWMVFAIPVALIAAEGFFGLHNLAKGIIKMFPLPKMVKLALSIAVILLVIHGLNQTSFSQKYAVNTAQWSPGGFWVGNEHLGTYVWMRDNLPPQTRVFTFTDDGALFGMNMYSCHWCKDVTEYQKSGFNETADENYLWLKQRNYEYLIIDAQTGRFFGDNETQQKLQDIGASGKYQPVIQNSGAVLLRLA